MQLLLTTIATKEKITAQQDDVEKQAALILENNKDANPEGVRQYVETQLLNEQVFQFLEQAQ